MRTRRAAAAITLAALAPIALAACTHSTPGSGTTPASGSDTATVSPSATDTTTPSATPTAATSTAKPSVSATATRTGPTVPGCQLTQLTVRALRGGAVAQQEIALITFTNVSTKTCSLDGFPGVSLRLNGAMLGQPAVRQATGYTLVSLAPGASGQVQLTDVSTCQAPLSDTVRIYPPNLTAYIDRPLVGMRGCQLFVSPVVHS